MKEPVVLVPGTLCDDLLFENQIRGLGDLFEFQVVSNSSADTLSEIARHILSGAQEKFTVVGLSYGGILAFELWRQAPGRINNLVLLNTNHRRPSESTMLNQQRFVGMAFLGEFDRITSDYLLEAMLHPRHARNPAIRKVVLQMARDVGRDAFLCQIKAQLNRPDSTKDLQGITCPTLILTGRQDQLCNVEIHQEMADLISNSTFEIIEECGHLSTLEQPERVNKVIREWWLKKGNINAQE